MPTITRKIQINFDCENGQLKEYYDKWFGYQRIVHKAANMVVSHQYLQEQIKDFFYLTEDIKLKLANVSKDEAGILNTSKGNTTYQVLSKKFKGEAPMGMLSGLNTVISKSFKAESKEVWKGERSVRNYKKTSLCL